MLIYSHAKPFKPCPLPSLMPVFSGHTCLIPYKENRYSLIYMHSPSPLSSQSFIHFRRRVKCLSSLSPKLVSLQVLAPFCSWSSNTACLATSLSSASVFLSSQRVVFLLAREPPAPVLNNKLKHMKREHQQQKRTLSPHPCGATAVFLLQFLKVLCQFALFLTSQSLVNTPVWFLSHSSAGTKSASFHGSSSLSPHTSPLSWVSLPWFRQNHGLVVALRPCSSAVSSPQ